MGMFEAKVAMMKETYTQSYLEYWYELPVFAFDLVTCEARISVEAVLWKLEYAEELSGVSAKLGNFTFSVSVKPRVTCLLTSTLSLLRRYDVNENCTRSDNSFYRIMSAYGLLADPCGKLQAKNKPPENYRGNTIGKPSKDMHIYVTLSYC